jgi:protein-disulfide isomerase
MIEQMAHRLEQKTAARAAREARQRRQAGARLRTRRLEWIGALVVAVVAVLAGVIAFGSGGGGSAKVATPKNPTAVATVKRLLDGIPQSGMTLGSPTAPVTITEYADIVCPVCAVYATTTEPQLIVQYVRSGRVKLVLRGLETASFSHNHSEYVPSQTAIRSAGLQGRAWDYLQLAYNEQPQTIGGAPAELSSYVTPAYLQGLAQQTPGLDLTAWQAGTATPALSAAVAADAGAAHAAGVNATPAEIVSGPRGSVQYDSNGTLPAVPTLAQLAALIKQVS